MTEIMWIALTATGTWILAIVTIIMTYLQHRVAITDLRVRHEVFFGERWDSRQMKEERRKLAKQFLTPPVPHEEIQETVLDFFESIGSLWLKKYLDESLVWSDFGYYVIRWWLVCKAYVEEERRQNQGDETIYEYFKRLAHRMSEVDAKERGLNMPEMLGDTDLKKFLKNEAALL